MRNINDEITRIERSHDNLWSIREDLHEKFDGLVKPHLVDGVLDAVAAGYEGRINRFHKIFIEKKAMFQLEEMAGAHPDFTVPGVWVARGLTAA
ncbi:hypothetical protein HMPREF0290_1429 [Corynebacterium efficiens YS-314]|uniref:Uncharacterized protein n=1 Tax=Corynebacterium efficiens (strain DSM 44549 / YS-314 / AJ 12310 / JCM 11189 / NBRC 100395) TaxID=196164 RepID=Q8FQT8_COREF|nr:hypothetical protein [Corynebacterium efficiens]EEW50015.1 hypothetical protein HMPREF0290_1429 [Corynebacterium efficiens YS-314]BAC17841.1 hypothetical protein [Corynebacterium efficiens YS-314]